MLLVPASSVITPLPAVTHPASAEGGLWAITDVEPSSLPLHIPDLIPLRSRCCIKWGLESAVSLGCRWGSSSSCRLAGKRLCSTSQAVSSEALFGFGPLSLQGGMELGTCSAAQTPRGCSQRSAVSRLHPQALAALGSCSLKKENETFQHRHSKAGDKTPPFSSAAAGDSPLPPCSLCCRLCVLLPSC